PGAVRAAVTPHLCGTDAVLQDRGGVHGVAQRPSAAFRHGRRPAERAAHPASLRAVPACRQGRAVARPGPRGAARARAARDARHRSVTPPDPARLALNTATVRAQWRLDAIIAGCERHGIRGIAPWRDQVADIGLAETKRRIRDAGLTVTGLCRGGFFTARGRAGGAAPLADTRRAVAHAAEVAAHG